MPPPSSATPVSFSDPLPQSVDVAIIGGGVVGIATAWHLARAGVSALVCEKGRIAGEQSSRNWGWVRQQGRDPAELPIMMESIRIWDSLAGQTGEDLGFRKHGVFYVAETDGEMAEYEAWRETARQHQLDTRMLTSDELGNAVPGLAGNFKGALLTPSDGRAEPFIAVPALARAAQRDGVAIAEDCAVRTVETTGGALSGIVTERGPVRCTAAVVAGGAWSSTFLRNLSVDLPQLTVKETVARTSPAPAGFEGNAATAGLAFRRRVDGGYSLSLPDFAEHFITADSFRYLRQFRHVLKASWSTVRLRFSGNPMATPAPGRWTADDKSPFEYIRVLDPPATRIALRDIERRLVSHLPGLKELEIVDSWAGMIDTTPDVVPVIDRAPGYDGLWIATGFSGHGFGIGPGAGRVVADLVQGKIPGHDLARFRFSRFTDGSTLDLGPAL